MVKTLIAGFIFRGGGTKFLYVTPPENQRLSYVKIDAWKMKFPFENGPF